MTTSGTVLVDQRQRRPGRELAVGLVDDHEPRRARSMHLAHGGLRLHHARGVVGRAQERDDRACLGQHPAHLVEVEREVRRPLALDDGGPGDAGDVAVQLVGRLERGDGAARAAVGEEQALQHLVRAVGREHLVGPTPCSSAIAARSSVAPRSG